MTTTTAEENKTTQQIPTPGDSSPPSLLTLARDAAVVTRGFLELLMLEIGIAARSVPVIIALGMVGFLLAIFTWLAFAAAVAWSCAALLGSTGWGMAAFLVLHLLALFFCRMAIKRYVRRLTLPNTRRFMQRIEESLHESHQ